MGIQREPCVIVCAGEIRDYAYIRSLIPQDAFIMAADGGYDRLKKMGVKPDMIIGDFDSVSCDGFAGENVYRYPAQKDDTDTALCIDKAVEMGYREILLLGAAGGRLDHTMANLSLLLSLNKRGVNGKLLDEKNIAYVLGQGEHAVQEEENRYVSFFAFGCEQAVITLSGFKYETEQYALIPEYPIGVSNETNGKNGFIHVHSGSILTILSKK